MSNSNPRQLHHAGRCDILLRNMTVLCAFSEWLSQQDAQTLGGLSSAVVLAAGWIFIKILRKLLGIAFFLCLVYVGLRLCGVDAGALLQL